MDPSIKNRFNSWVVLTVFSAVVLGVFVEDFAKSERGPKANFVISCCSIALAVGFMVMTAYLFYSQKIDIQVEGGIAVLLLALWCACIAVVQHPDNGFATIPLPYAKSEIIRNANLYFFSWLAFLAAVQITASVAQEMKLVDVQTTSKKLIHWYLILATSIVVLGSSSSLKSSTCSSLCLDGSETCYDNRLCKRTKFAISVGAIDSCIAIASILWIHLGDIFKSVEMAFSAVVVVLYSFGVALITSSPGPGATIGNLYFFTWIGFGLSALLAFMCVKDLLVPEVTEEDEPSTR